MLGAPRRAGSTDRRACCSGGPRPSPATPPHATTAVWGTRRGTSGLPAAAAPWNGAARLAIAHSTPDLAPPPTARALAHATTLPLPRADQQPWTVPGARLAPHARGPKQCATGPRHPLARGLCPHASHGPVGCPLVFSWSTAWQVLSVPGRLGMTAGLGMFFFVFLLRRRRLTPAFSCCRKWERSGRWRQSAARRC
jgi:hypothetical protein